ncbi:hypothetical protein RND71_021842 [Anisodus tanguticus]|uniref:Uncharacterized protein n=1 Tax=Anisodus tanguticus TaxID=243964 RepID=A0AAE1RYU3_9SOLA|nr:hypothetical protein RND71_021842 [Anisodus tanguticus]
MSKQGSSTKLVDEKTESEKDESTEDSDFKEIDDYNESEGVQDPSQQRIMMITRQTMLWERDALQIPARSFGERALIAIAIVPPYEHHDTVSIERKGREWTNHNLSINLPDHSLGSPLVILRYTARHPPEFLRKMVYL